MTNWNKKHAQVPDELFSSELKFGDKLVYANIRKHADKQTLKCFPRIDTIAEDCGLSERTVSAAIKRLEKAGLLKVTPRKGTSNEYTFYKLEDGFERFSDDFLKLDISPQAKSYYIELQQHLFLNSEKGTNETTYSNTEIGKKIGLSSNSVRKYNAELIRAGMLSENVLTTLDNCGLKQVKKSFDLYALNQAVIYKLQEHEEKLDEHDQEIINLKTENEVLTRRITALEKMVGLQNNTYIEDLKVSF